MKKDLSNPGSLVTAAAKRIPALWWGIAVAAILGLIAIVSRWHVPVPAMVLGGIGLFVGMFGLVIFAGLVQPMPRQAKAPAVSKATIWAFAVLLIGAGFLSASSFFFDWPIPLRSQFFLHPVVPVDVQHGEAQTQAITQINKKVDELRALTANERTVRLVDMLASANADELVALCRAGITPLQVQNALAQK